MEAGALVALVFGVAGTVLSLGALAWQAWTYVKSGPVVRVTATWGRRTDNRGGVIHLPLDQPPTRENLERLGTMGAHGDPVWVVTATNLGRTPTTVTEVGADYMGAGSFHQVGRELGQRLG